MACRQSAWGIASLVASIVAVAVSVVAFTITARAHAANPWLNVYCPGGMKPLLYVLSALFADLAAIWIAVQAQKHHGRLLAGVGMCLTVPAATISFFWILGYVG